ncbi:MAG: SDR family oxidoreductase [Rhizobiaceae bacterium]|nr:SDR family oxidoreductase [Rhizobiaceae bacterium]
MGVLDGKAAVITGAGGGLGEAYAVYVASLGAAVVVNDIDAAAADRTAARITEAGGWAIAVAGDVSRWDFAEELVECCISAFGLITGIVNNAGLLRPATMADATEQDFRAILGVNVMGTAACAQAAARRMLESGRGGSIVNVTSGSHAGDIGLGAYAATKGAIASLTYSWAMELRGTGVRMNALSPRGLTGMSGQNAGQRDEQLKHRPVNAGAIPAAEVNAPVVGYLLSDLSRDIHGQVVRISGDKLAFLSHPKVAQPVLTGEWTFDAVAVAFRDILGSRQHVLGLATEPASGT